MLASALWGCQRNVEVSAQLVPVDPSNIGLCLAPDQDAGIASPNVVVLDLFEYRSDDTSNDGRAPGCVRCARGEVECRHLARQCVCGPDIADFDQLEEAFRRARLDDAPEGVELCLRLSTVRDVTAGGSRRDCSAEPVCVDPTPLTERASFCMLGEPFDVETALLVTLRSVACLALDERVLRCKDHDCTCDLDEPDAGTARCLIETQRDQPICQSGCGLEIADRCYRFSPGCSLQAVGALTVAECTSF
ncbi:MAG: hypothetical protein AB7P00_37020 [Sandaracinaceae bacterium]